MTSDPPDLGKGFFGYRKSAVNQILADRDVMLRQAEGRVRAAESKVAELQTELTSMKDRNTRMDEQLERLRAQVDALSARAEPAPAAPPTFHAPIPLAEETPTTPAPDPVPGWDTETGAWEEQWNDPSQGSASPYGEEGAAAYGEEAGAAPYDEYGESVASFEGLDQVPAATELESIGDMPMVFEESEALHGEATGAADLFGQQDYEGESGGDLVFGTPVPEEDHGFHNWVDSDPPPAPEPMRKVDEMRYQPEDYPETPQPPQGGEDEGLSAASYGFSLHPATPEDSGEHADLGDQPVFRGFTDEPFDEPSPSQYLTGSGMTETVPSPLPAQPAPEWPAEPAPHWASEASQPAPDWPSQSTPPTPDWPSPSTPAPEWTTPPAPAPATEWTPAPAPAPEWSTPPAPAPAAEWAPPPSRPAPEPPPPAAAPVQSGPGVSAQSSDITNRFLTEELRGILSAAEESAARILERARVTSEHQVAQSNRLWREVQAELARFSTWREQVEPVIRSVHAKVEGVRAQIEEVPEKIRQALAPMADSISMIDSDLAELSSASTPPLLLTPSGLDPGSPLNEWPIGETDPASPQSGEGHAARGEDTGHLAG